MRRYGPGLRRNQEKIAERLRRTRVNVEKQLAEIAVRLPAMLDSYMCTPFRGIDRTDFSREERTCSTCHYKYLLAIQSSCGGCVSYSAWRRP